MGLVLGKQIIKAVMPLIIHYLIANFYVGTVIKIQGVLEDPKIEQGQVESQALNSSRRLLLC